MKTAGQKKLIILCGGGTAGSVVPLLAMIDRLKTEGYALLWLGTKFGPERAMVEHEKIEFLSISGGKFRRYFSWKNIRDLYLVLVGFLESLLILRKRRPCLVMSAGSYVSVPLVWAASFLKIPSIIHQMDARPGLANRLMAPLATIITVSLSKSLNDYGVKARLVGNPIREEFLNYKITPRDSRQKLGLNYDLPVVLVMGGGTGAMALNQLVWESLKELTRFCQVLHITGIDKGSAHFINEPHQGYKPFDFLNIDGMIKAYSAATIVVCRSGMGTLTEISYLRKPSILIPMPDTHQEDNALIFKNLNAAIVLDQRKLNGNLFTACIRNLLADKEKRDEIAKNAGQAIGTDTKGLMIGLIKDLTAKA